LVESRLSGKHKVTLTAPTTTITESLKKIPQISDVRLWPVPFEVWKNQAQLDQKGAEAAGREVAVFQAIPRLMVGRALYFKGRFDGEMGAKRCFLDVRPPDSVIQDYKFPKETADRIPKEQLSKAEASYIYLLQQGKQTASYWLGLISFEQQSYPEAIDFFAKRTLEAAPNGPWSSGARYNLARSFEASGDVDRAVALFEADKDSPQSEGNRLRAKWLKQRQNGNPPEPAAAAAE